MFKLVNFPSQVYTKISIIFVAKVGFCSFLNATPKGGFSTLCPWAIDKVLTKHPFFHDPQLMADQTPKLSQSPRFSAMFSF